jgi:hypothetical protein
VNFRLEPNSEKRRFHFAENRSNFEFKKRRTVNYRLLTYYLVPVCLLLGSCNMDRRVEGSKEAVEKMKSMQIKRVTNPQVIEIVDDWGERIVKQAQLQLESVLSKPHADFSQLCQLKGTQKIDSLANLYAVQISLLGAKDVKNPTLSTKEQEVMDAYLYNAENKISQISNIQKLGDSLFIYTSPIPLTNLVCQKCFGEDATHLAVWRVRFRKSDIIRKVNAKSLEKKRKS